MKRYYKKIGDIYVYVFNGKIRYAQYIAIDELQLFGDVVRVFQGEHDASNPMNIKDILTLSVDFYAITYVSNCVKTGKWEKVGNSCSIGDNRAVKFRCAADYGLTLNGKPIEKSNNWYVWTLGDSTHTQLGNLVEEWRNAHIGDLLPPQYINERMENGYYKFVYPEPQ
jgi:hypothetical protein